MRSISNLDKFMDKIRARKLCKGLVVTLNDLTVSELAAESGYDFTWIDMEHAPLTMESALHHVIALKGTDCAPLIRVNWNRAEVIKPVLDLAPAGIIIPMVNTAEEASSAVRACRYPPEGIRGCFVRRADRFGRTPFSEYLKASESDPMVIIQIETMEAVRNLDEILKVPGIGSICIGPLDLSGFMGKLGQIDDPGLNSTIDMICEKVRAAGILLGTATGFFEPWKKRGLDWIAVTSDFASLVAYSKIILSDNTL